MNKKNIFDGLESAHSNERVTTLRNIRQQPEQALKACTDAGKDLIGLLLDLRERYLNSSEHWEFVSTVLRFADERTAELAKDIFVSYTDNKFMVMAANRINLMSDEEKIAFLPAILLSDSNKNRIRLCANLLAGNPLLDTRTALRVCAVSDLKCTLPNFDNSTVDVWIEEMQGKYRQSVRKKFMSINKTDLLLTRWDRIESELKVWVITNLIQKNPGTYDVMTSYILQNEDNKQVILAALTCTQGMRESVPERLLMHEDEEIRAKAVLYSRDIPLTNMLTKETSAQVIANIILKLSSDPVNLSLISGYFADNRWQVRAAAAKGMVMLAPESVGTLQNLFHSDDPNVRLSAMRCLCDLNMQNWVEANLPS